jgi:serine/threonine-protein kinase
MKPDRWQQIDQLLEAALEKEKDQRAAFLDQACAGDQALHQEVETLLAAHDQVEGFIEGPALEVAAKGIVEDQGQSFAGQDIGSYKIISLLGAGGMGEVYRAMDTKLEREVAIKVLPTEFSQDRQRLARFEREAKLLASLNHPNIAVLYGQEEVEEKRFLVLELVEGETLAERLTKGPLALEEALEVCRQIAEGVEAAHEKGVIHRDLKPANVKITPEGKVKILDFGLAKAFEREAPVADISQSPTLTEEMTRAGVILGTAAYMSPEQARGKAVDKRSDVFAFGCVLYELLTGKRAFGGETVTDTLAKILEGEPDWNVLSPTVPGTIRFLMSRCLQKDPGKRLQHIDGARILIEEVLSGTTTLSPIGATIQLPLWKRAIPWTIAAVSVVVAGFALWSLTGPTPELIGPESVKKFEIAAPAVTPLGSSGGRDLAVSPNGKHLVYKSTGRQLYLRSIDQLEVKPVSGTEGAGSNFFFSPEGDWLVFNSGTQLKKVSLAGGSAVSLTDVPWLEGGSWGPDETIFFAAGGDLYRIPASGGEPEILATSEDDESYSWPKILPGGQAVVFTIRHGFANHRSALLSLETGAQKILIERAKMADYFPSGHLVYERSGTLMAVRFDLTRLEIMGQPVPVLEGVRTSDVGAVDYSLSDEGTLAYVSADWGALHEHQLVWVDRQGRESLVTEETGDFRNPRISPDGKRVVLPRFERNSRNVWIYEFEEDSLSRLTFEEERNGTAIWSPDGEWIVYQTGSTDGRYLARQRADRGSPSEQLTSVTPDTQIPNSWTPDGQLLFINSGGDIVTLSMDGDREPEAVVASPYGECCSKLSPDGNWLAYVSHETGQQQVYVTSYPRADVKWLISAEEGGGQPVWSPDGSELLYRTGDKMMVVSVRTEPTFRESRPRVLFEGSYVSHSAPIGMQYYDISPDGKRFLMLKETEEQAQNQIQVVLNWSEELKRLVPTN